MRQTLCDRCNDPTETPYLVASFRKAPACNQTELELDLCPPCHNLLTHFLAPIWHHG